MHLSVLVAAAITLVASVGVFLWLPARAPAPDIPAAQPGAPLADGDGDRLDETPIPAATS
jgi:hypothetical protein